MRVYEVIPFDIRTPDTAYYFLQEFLGVSGEDFITEYILECDRDFSVFWDKWYNRVKDITIDNLELIAFHVTSNGDNCSEIKENGIKNLQLVLSEATNLNAVLYSHDIQFDISKKQLHVGKRIIDVDYDKYRGRFDLNPIEEKVKRVAHKLYYDYQVNAFFSNNDVSDYGTSIHQRPEFFYNLVELFPQLKGIENEWIEKSKGYIITFCAPLEQFAWFTFYDHECDYIDDNSDKLQVKRWMLSQAITRSFDSIDSQSEVFAYMKPQTVIQPPQIIDYQEIVQ